MRNENKNDHLRITLAILSSGFVPILFFSSILPSRLTIANNGLDGGDLMAAVLSGGVPHPSGYPTYLLFARLFQQLPLESPFFKGALLSFVSAVITIFMAGLLTLWMGREKKRGVAGIFTGLCLSATSLFISQAVIVEVYALQSLFVICYLIWLWLAVEKDQATRSLLFTQAILALLCGLALGNHVTIVFLIPLFVFGLVYLYKKGWPKIWLWLYLLFFLSGLLVYFYLPWLAKSYPPVNWGNPQSIDNLIWLVSGNLYQNNLFNLSAVQIWERLKALSTFFLTNFGPFALFVGIISGFNTEENSRFNLALRYTFFISILFSIFYATNDSMVYLLPAVIVFAIWVGAAVPYLWQLKWRFLSWGRILLILVVLEAVFLLFQTRSQVDPRREQEAAAFAESYLGSVPKGAILLTGADADTFPLWYYHYGLGWRSDVKIITLGLLKYDWYRENLSHNYPDLMISADLSEQYSDVWIDKLSLMNNKTTICRSWPVPDDRYEIKTKCY